MVEQPIRNRQVVGSTPTLGSIYLVWNERALLRINPEFLETGARLVQVRWFGEDSVHAVMLFQPLGEKLLADADTDLHPA